MDVSNSRESIRLVQWLNQVLLPYPARGQALVQIQVALESYSTLLPKTEPFTFDDGRTALLVSLTGTIPVNYRGARYNIPIAVWLPFEFPSEPPIIFVTPTNDMIIRKGAYVEPGGKCVGGYFDSWSSKSEACCLKNLLEFLQETFSREPPLYSKPKPPAPAYSSQPPPIPSTSRIPSTSSQQPTRPPLPPELARSNSSLTNHDPQARPQPPSRPPLPPPLYSQTPSSITPATNSSAFTVTHSPYPSDAMLTSNSLDPMQGIMPVSESNSTHLQASGRASVGSRHPHPSLDIGPRSQEARRSVSDFSALPPSKAHEDSFNLTCGPIERPTQSTKAQGIPPSSQAQNLLDEPLDDQAPRSNQSLTNIPRPPRPPNPELIYFRQLVHSKLNAEVGQLQMRLESERKQLEILETDLLKGEPAMMDEMARLEAVRDVCVNVGERYQELIDQLTARIDDLSHHRKPVDVDELVCSTTVLYNQLWELIINDKVIDDLIYHLSRALNNTDGPKIDLDKFLKRVRTLGHEQFLNRVMINQICDRLGFSLSPST